MPSQRLAPLFSTMLRTMLLLGLLTFSPNLLAAPEEEPYSETVDVRVINLEAVVEDGDGRRVEGLGIDDFEILVDGKSRPVEYFSEIRGGLAAPEPADDAAPSQAPPSPAPSSVRPPGMAQSGRVPTSYVVFVDLVMSDPRQVESATKQLESDLGQLPPEDKIAIFVFDGRRLENLADWRDRREVTLSALRSVPTIRSTAITELAEQSAAESRRIQVDDLEISGTDLEDRARRMSRRLEATFTAVSTTMRTAAPPPGRRVLLNFAGAWPRDLAVYLGIDPGSSAGGVASRIRSSYPLKAYSGVYETANRLGYTIYAADLFKGRSVGGNAAIGGVQDAQNARQVGFDRDFERDATLMRYAEQTGGQAFTGGWGDDTLAKVQDDLASFYWLGISAKRQDNDKSHKLEVKVKKPGLKVRSRREYSDLSRKAEVDQELESRLLFSRTREKQDFLVIPGEPVLKRSETTLPITFRIPLDLVVFLPKGKTFLADLELRVAALDERGQRSPIPSIPVPLEGPQPQPGQYATYETQLRLRKESRRFVLGLYDKKGDRLLVSTVDLDQQRR